MCDKLKRGVCFPRYLPSPPSQSPLHTPTPTAVVEALRRTAELVAWGDAHDATLVDYFLEARVLAAAAALARTPPGRSPPIGTQLLQSLAILVSSLRSRPALYYLFSGGVLDAVLKRSLTFPRMTNSSATTSAS